MRNDLDLNQPLLRLFADVDAATTAFAHASGLRCPEQCGACCESPGVHTTVTELMPLAQDAVQRGVAADILERAQAAGPGPCIFYAATGPGRGRCTIYAFRPMICRLFGFAAVRSKRGTPELAACRVHGQAQPQAVEHARALIAGGLEAPLFSEYQEQAVALGPSSTGELVPINVAVARAMERALFVAELAAQSHTQEGPVELGAELPVVSGIDAGIDAGIEPAIQIPAAALLPAEPQNDEHEPTKPKRPARGRGRPRRRAA